MFRYDVIIYPTPLAFTVVYDGTVNCSTPTIELTAADGTVCETAPGQSCVADGDMFMSDFGATTTGMVLADAPLGCSLPADITVLCAGCDVCPNTLMLSDIISSGTYHAGQSVDANGIVPNGNNIIIKAGQIISLQNGFGVEPGAGCTIEIEDCN